MEKIKGDRTFNENDIIRFEDPDIMQNGTVSFYIPCWFDVKAILGEKSVPNGDGYVNVYATYDSEKRALEDKLDVVVVNGDGSEKDYIYELSESERQIFCKVLESDYLGVIKTREIIDNIESAMTRLGFKVVGGEIDSLILRDVKNGKDYKITLEEFR